MLRENINDNSESFQKNEQEKQSTSPEIPEALKNIIQETKMWLYNVLILNEDSDLHTKENTVLVKISPFKKRKWRNNVVGRGNFVLEYAAGYENNYYGGYQDPTYSGTVQAKTEEEAQETVGKVYGDLNFPNGFIVDSWNRSS